MAYSLRTQIVVITVGGVWLAAQLSGSTLFLAVVAQPRMLFIALSLALAICAADASRRAFWGGFFMVALLNLALTSPRIVDGRIASGLLRQEHCFEITRRSSLPERPCVTGNIVPDILLALIAAFAA